MPKVSGPRGEVEISGPSAWMKCFLLCLPQSTESHSPITKWNRKDSCFRSFNVNASRPQKEVSPGETDDIISPF